LKSLTSGRAPAPNIAKPASLHLPICFTQGQSSTLCSAAARFHNQSPPPMRRVAMQLTLAVLELPRPAQPPLSHQLDAKARAEALDILARIIAQAFEAAKQTEATNE
jgi:hypothetical protein